MRWWLTFLTARPDKYDSSIWWRNPKGDPTYIKWVYLRAIRDGINDLKED